MTALTDRPQVETPSWEQMQRRNRFLTVTVIVLAVALVAVGIWVVYDQTAGVEGAVTPEIEQLLGDYETAFNNYDPDAWRALVTDDFLVEDRAHFQPGDELFYVRGESSTVDEAAGSLGASFRLYDVQMEFVGEPMMAYDGPWYVAQLENATDKDNQYSGMSVYVIVDEDGTLKVADKIWAGFLEEREGS